ncbi:Purine permease 1 [Hibiscus syriacus]|uniref:Purine permease 1 n=1 Tax=Hibiscus syriacus TaxID=106335 RepID=A0A6A2XBI2_HIBSY|nr:Purine permease 1 [Hibiscus syriacus]
MKPRLFIPSAVIGILTGLDNYFFAYGVSLLPVSTCNLILASQLAFTAVFAFLLVKQKFSAYSINAVFLLTIGAGILAVPASSSEIENESTKKYTIGFLMTLAAAALYGLVLPLVELMYQKANQEITYALVLEIQLLTSVFATAFCTIGMLINNDFKAIGREAKEFELGETKYYIVAVFSAILWQGYFLGGMGIVFCASSLLSGMVTAIQLPVLEILAVIFFREKFEAEKGLSLVLSLWGFLSYFYPDMKKIKNKKKETPQTHTKSVELPNRPDDNSSV